MAARHAADMAEDRKPARALRVLVVDDDRDWLWSLLVLLEQEGHDVRGAFNVTEALDVLRTFDADAVIANTVLPGMSAYELAGKLRRENTKPLLIAMSREYKKTRTKSWPNATHAITTS